ncbi:ABC transporter permease subunit [Chitinophaga silvatica]|uniref:ABC transporter permease subunit n=1 Tax=Chitinophaga silvatica TaxID=2282649 RepID=A0A3E1YC08_9BACT|nr:ABC transporter permease subunit [Chitinophaga silvatica]RFS23867.1 ABC transporter permease subunit [Chitinophaga silvatica]
MIKSFFEPLRIINRKAMLALIIVEVVIALAAWQLSGGGLIPTPLKVLQTLGKMVQEPSFIDNLFSSVVLTIKGMFISIIIALVISYLSIIPFFNPIARFVIKCRYLTLTGLIFLFTLLTQNGHELKLSLLIFGIVPFFVTSLLSVIDEINKQEFELCTTLRMNSWKTLWEVVVIGRLDQVFEVMRQNFAIAWLMITTVEGLSMSEGGLGVMLIRANKYVQLDVVFSTLVVIFLLGIFFDFILGKFREWLFPYTKLSTRN